MEWNVEQLKGQEVEIVRSLVATSENDEEYFIFLREEKKVFHGHLRFLNILRAESASL